MKRKIDPCNLKDTKDRSLIEMIQYLYTGEKRSIVFRVDKKDQLIRNANYIRTFKDLEIDFDYYKLELYYDPDDILEPEDNFLNENEIRFEELF